MTLTYQKRLLELAKELEKISDRMFVDINSELTTEMKLYLSSKIKFLVGFISTLDENGDVFNEKSNP